MCYEKYTYAATDQKNVHSMLEALQHNGATITGNNPWEVDTHAYGIKLIGSWDQRKQALAFELASMEWYVPCSNIWSELAIFMRLPCPGHGEQELISQCPMPGPPDH
jgi:hypothetical protein